LQAMQAHGTYYLFVNIGAICPVRAWYFAALAPQSFRLQSCFDPMR
jgi:hypothetical protein